jgi:GNAT superfamily N-acetyltransferase
MMNIRSCTHEDLARIREEITQFWGSDRTLHLHHPMFVREFGDTAFVACDAEQVIGYLFGFLSQTEPTGYVHLVAVRESYKGQGVGRRLYYHFSDIAKRRGCTTMKAITTPTNSASIAFHKALGFELDGLPNVDGIPVVQDYAGKGNDTVVFRKILRQQKNSEQSHPTDAAKPRR